MATDKEKANQEAAAAKEKAQDSKKQESKKAAAKKKPTAKDQLKAAQEQINQLTKEKDELEDKYLRAEAEMANMQTRYKKEQEQLLKYQSQRLATAVLPVIDNLNRALEIEVDDEASKNLKQGVEMVAKDLNKAFTDNEITKIESLGKKFDPTLHQAVKSVPAEDGQEPETIVEVFQDGYMLKDRVLRPAMVVVAQ
ncbi:MAG TPA: nucleotide exchange factor GrpE [Candidatus Ligilactobacillus avistercoris]|nr:nucleotide exchange factor GrpE [Candidatus Ligilactobacillus avistercoris]